MIMNKKIMARVLSGLLAASVLGSCATARRLEPVPQRQTTPKQVAEETHLLFEQLKTLGFQIVRVGGPGEAQIVCACTPIAKPDKPGPRGPLTPAEREA